MIFQALGQALGGAGGALAGALEGAGGALASSLENTMGDVVNLVDDPMAAIGKTLQNTDLFELAQNPEKYAADQLAKIGQGESSPMPTPQIGPLPGPNFSIGTGGFVNQNPNFLNTDQLILSRLMQ